MKKVVIYFFLAVLLGVLIYEGQKYYAQRFGIDEIFSVSDNLLAVKYNNGKCIIKNEASGKIVGNQYDKVFNTSWWDRRVVIVVKNGLRGYISAKTGEIIVEPQYRNAWIEGKDNYLAACVDTLGKLGFIDVRTGKTIIPHKFDCYIPNTEYNDGGGNYDDEIDEIDDYVEYIFHDGLCEIENSEGKYGIIDTLGNEVLPVLYDKIEYNMNNGFIKVTNDEKVGLLDFNTRDTVFPLLYNDINFDYDYSYAGEGDEDEDEILRVNFIIANSGETTYVYDKKLNTKWILEGIWQHIEILENGYIKAYDDEGYTAIFNSTGREIYSFTEKF